jgi:hypothetical protein
MLQQDPDQFGIQLAQDAPTLGRVPCIDLAVLFPQFEEQFDLPALALQHDGLFQAQAFCGSISQQEQPARLGSSA